LERIGMSGKVSGIVRLPGRLWRAAGAVLDPQLERKSHTESDSCLGIGRQPGLGAPSKVNDRPAFPVDTG